MARSPSVWTRLSAGKGTKGARLYDWACCELADRDGADYEQAGLWTRGLQIRRSLGLGLPRFGRHRERFRVRCFSDAQDPSRIPR